MRSLWTEIEYLQSVDRLLDRNSVNNGGLDLSKEALWVFVGKRVAELQTVKVKVQKKKTCRLAQLGQSKFEPGWMEYIFFLNSNFDSL